MNSPTGKPGGQSDSFARTRWNVILAAGKIDSEPEKARAALGELCRAYWGPLYNFVRRRGYSVHDAQDLTQSFFAHLIEHKIYARANRERGRFRSFLLAALKNFLANAYAHAHTLKRGGSREFLPLCDNHAEPAEPLLQTRFTNGGADSGESELDRSWAEALVSAGLERLAAEYQREGKQSLFEHLKVFVVASADPVPAYDQLAVKTGLPASTLRSHVTRLRMRYRELLRAELRQSVASEAEVDVELRELFRLLAK